MHRLTVHLGIEAQRLSSSRDAMKSSRKMEKTSAHQDPPSGELFGKHKEGGCELRNRNELIYSCYAASIV